jgi:integrase
MAVRRTATGYQIQWYDADGRFRKRTVKGITREEAVRIERQTLAARDRGEPQPDLRNAPLFGAFATSWVEENRSAWKPSTRQQYEQVLKSQLRPAFEDVRLSNLTESRVKQLITQLQDAGLSARRINLVMLVLKQIVRTAVRRRLIREDPTAALRKLREPRTEVDPLEPHEVAAFLATCPAWWHPYFTVAFYTGARPNELAALKMSDLDLGRATLRIRAGRYRGVESTPKTPASVRDVRLLPVVLGAIKAQQGQVAAMRLKRGLGAPAVGEDYLFVGPEGGLLNMNFLRVAVWYPTLTKARLRRRTMYQTRHTFASNALAAGETPPWVSGMLGHTTPEMLFRVYARFIPNRTRHDGSALAERMTSPGRADGDGSGVLPIYSRAHGDRSVST